ncbi:MAG: UDP-N-acetylmuramoyl-L-alanyl-D-glutamate--2,6-diaminopimelate ligase [Planctomycetota bacterium]|jgi:UDP-N-acetylmuramoyl-L-alanyl-D-glutamate--2,6-diaminopimelate ligase
MKLCDIVSSCGRYDLCGDADLEVSGICCDSRECRPGYIFAAVNGTNHDGGNFCAQAIENGANSIISESKVDFPVSQIIVPDARLALARMCEQFYSNPSGKLNIAGITGTNGKTTTAFLTKHILSYAGIKCGMLGTVCCSNGNETIESKMTTPDSVEFTKYLSEMVKNKCQSAVVEVSSHSLAQHRVSGAKFKVAVFTNLSRDHLDYHGSMEDYGNAKSLLFRTLQKESTAVLNADDPYSKVISENLSAEILWYSLNDKRDLYAEILDMSLLGSRLRFVFNGDSVVFDTVLVGRHNVYNMLSAVLCCVALDVEFKDAVNALTEFTGVPGRLQGVTNNEGIHVFVDYAHTDDALKNVLSIIKPLCQGKVITVFGCGGDRDRGKRPMMAEVAECYSDAVFVTNDNPRTEDVEQIFSDIRSGFKDLHKIVFEPERPVAVEQAILSAQKEDVVLIAGKGHENYQIIGEEKIHMDDLELALTALELKGQENK